jgi:hypothetical protein
MVRPRTPTTIGRSARAAASAADVAPTAEAARVVPVTVPLPLAEFLVNVTPARPMLRVEAPVELEEQWRIGTPMIMTAGMRRSSIASLLRRWSCPNGSVWLWVDRPTRALPAKHHARISLPCPP